MTDGTTQLWNTDLQAGTGTLERTLKGHDLDVLDAEFSPDGKLLATAGYDGTARVWNVATGKSVAVLHEQAGTLVSAIFSHDGRLLVTSSHIGPARVWNVSTGELLATIAGETAPIIAARFTPDDESVLTIDQEGVVRSVPCDTCGGLKDLLTLAESRATRSLTPAERAQFLQEPTA
jgi:WD40 repeat protein